MSYLIDDPGPFEPIEVWREHLRELKKLPEGDERLRLSIERAERYIALMEERQKEDKEKERSK
jgi:hypothetical protein